MQTQELRNVDDYEVFLTETMSLWSSQQRVAFAAAVAQSWLPAYEAFAAEESWGDPATLRRGLDAVWSHVQGAALAQADLARHQQLIDDITPHMDDFDAPEALIACCVVRDALRSCGDPANSLPHALHAVLGVFEGLVEEWPIDPASQSRVWQKSALRKELKAQLQLIDEVAAVPSFTADRVQSLRSRIAGLKSKPARPQPQRKGPAALTNQTLFEQYRRMVESDLRGQVQGQPEPPAGSFLFAITYLGYWLGRYSRRMQTINGSYGKVADEPGQRALVACNRARDAAEPGQPRWEPEVSQAFELCLANNSQLGVLDAPTTQTPHAYGPSLRRLWLAGRRLGPSDRAAWQHILTWASHRPAAWPAEDQRKHQGLAHSNPHLGAHLARPLTWHPTSNPFHPWATEVDGTRWQIRINDFPDELLYSLIINEVSSGNFHDWPQAWQRGESMLLNPARS